MSWGVVHGASIAVLLGVLASLATTRRAPAAESADRPNILFILTDDLGYGDLGCYGHQVIRTPHLDRLAADGMRFTQFYVTSPVCTPTRASFLTGRHPQRFDIHHADLPERLPRYPLPLEATTLGDWLGRHGYHTAHFGKWHLGEPPETGMPREHGFKYFFGGLGGRPSSSWIRYARYDDAQFIVNEEQPRTYTGYATDVTTDAVIDHLERVSRDRRPFYINVWYHAPHEPLSPRVEQAALYRDPDDLTDKQQVYFGTVTNMDAGVGRILARLDELGLSDRTLVLFSSDNGPEVHDYRYAAGSAGPLRGMKTQLWEGGIRVPLVARLPGVVRRGETSDAVASALDWFPTICEVADIPLPEDVQFDEGQSLASVLRDGGSLPSRTLYWEFHGRQRGGPPSGSLVVRDGDWKLHLDPDQENAARLYNLARDVGEQHDLSAAEPAITRRLTNLARHWYETLPRETAESQRVPTPESEEEANRLPM